MGSHCQRNLVLLVFFYQGILFVLLSVCGTGVLHCGNFVLLSSEVGILCSPVFDLFWG